MRDIIEILYDDCEPMLNEDDSSIMKLAKVKMEYLDMLEDSMSCEQKELRSALSEVECKIDDIMDIGRFRYAFHLGAQLMAELIEGKNYLQEKNKYKKQ